MAHFSLIVALGVPYDNSQAFSIEHSVSSELSKSPESLKAGVIPLLDNFSPVPSDIEDRFLSRAGIGEKSALRHKLGSDYRYKSSRDIDYDSSDWAANLPADLNALNPYVELARDDRKPYQNDDGVWLLLIDITRVEGVPHYYYYANADRAQIPYEPWSSAKFLSSSALLSKMRKESDGSLGAGANINGYSTGNLFTQAFSYKASGNVSSSSNEVSNFILRSATEDYASSLITDWLKVNDGSAFFGKYGRPVFDPGTSVWTDGRESLSLSFDYYSGRDAKAMSLLTMAEWLKRLAMHADDVATRLPYVDEFDIETLFYGDQKTAELGGAAKGTSVYVSRALTGRPDLIGGREDPYDTVNASLSQILDERVGKSWRIFHKNGAGPSSSRERSEVTYLAYVTLPNYKNGREFILAARSSLKVEGCRENGSCVSRLEEASDMLARSIQNVVEFALE